MYGACASPSAPTPLHPSLSRGCFPGVGRLSSPVARFPPGELHRSVTSTAGSSPNDEAAAPLLDAVALASYHEQWIVAGDARAILARTALIRGDLAQAERRIGEALEFAHTHGYEDLPHVGYSSPHSVCSSFVRETWTRPITRSAWQSSRCRAGSRSSWQRRSWEELSSAKRLERGPRRGRCSGEARAIIDSRPDPVVLSHNGSKKWRLSHSTVHSHTKSLYRKIQGSSREEVFGRA